MEFLEILQGLRDEIDADDKVREKVLPLSREAIRKCSESIKKTHKGAYEDAWKLISDARKIVDEATESIVDSSFMSASRVLDVAYQELAEAVNLLSLIEKGKYTMPSEYQIPSRPYLTGLADVIGELRRAALDFLRKDDVNRAETMLNLMEDILEGLQNFDYPNALVPDLRRKCDVGRSLVERTRGDLTRAVGQSRLVRELSDFEKRIKGD
ncbi:MAG: haloacid dehalogenase [Candidatus Thorarchaeota archaeon]|nr:haloacid dehalogenase [Candidatus Thorarchaeota archaeon]